MDPMLESFISESRDNLETAGRCFLELEKRPGDDELLNDLFRSMHTIKGSSGLFDIPAFTKVVHAAEDVLDTVRSGELVMTPDHIDLFLDAMDHVSAWLDNLESNGLLGDEVENSSQTLVRDLRALLNETAQANQDPDIEPEISSPALDTMEEETSLCEPPGWLVAMPEQLRLELYARLRDEHVDILAIEYTPDPQCFFSGDDPLHTVRTLPGLVWFTIQSREAWPEPVEMDPYQCGLVFYAAAAGAESEIRHHLRYVSEQARTVRLAPVQLAIPSGEPGDGEPFAPFIEESRLIIAKSDWPALRQRIGPLLEISGPDLLQTSVLRWMNALVQEEAPDSKVLEALHCALDTNEFRWPEFTERSMTTDSQKKNTTKVVLSCNSDIHAQASVLEALTVQRQILSISCAPELLSGRISSVATVIRNLLVAADIPLNNLENVIKESLEEGTAHYLLGFVDNLLLEMTKNSKEDKPECNTAHELNPVGQKYARTDTGSMGDDISGSRSQFVSKDAAKTNVGSSQQSAQSRTLKVDQQRIDALMDLVGELVVAKNALPFLARRAENEFGIRSLAKEIKSQYAVIDRLSEELQGAMMQIRMVPISSVFQRFPRLVRDLSRKLDKQIHLVLEGEETEADKNVVENLADPLIHLVRNSLDHGLETAIERQAAGKPPEGAIILRAIPHDDQVVIEVIDDGRGIDPEIIKRKAYEKEIIDEQQLDTLTDFDALQLIFAAGFSTAEQVSDLSGRGVGMDVVRSVVRQAGGNVVVESKKGEGTTIRLTLPLSMAVTRVMMVEVAGQCYGIAMEDIVETVRIPTGDIQRIKHSKAIVLRDRIVPLFYLRDLLQVEADDTDDAEVAVLVMAVTGKEVGLVIDEFHEGLDIIQKPLEGVMANYPWYAGSALLGDGRVLLVLNIRELLSCQ